MRPNQRGFLTGVFIGILIACFVGPVLLFLDAAAGVFWLVAILLISGMIGYSVVESSERNKRSAVESRERYWAEQLLRTRKRLRRIPALVADAEAHLKQAELNYAQGAFAPFWDAIENVTYSLAEYCHLLELIGRTAIEYQQAIAEGAVDLPPFPLTTNNLANAQSITRRLTELVRSAQKNFQFAMIFEQRKTNRILVEGFGHLGSALYGISDLISASFSDLSITMNEILRNQVKQNEMLDDMRQCRDRS